MPSSFSIAVLLIASNRMFMASNACAWKTDVGSVPNSVL